MSYVNKQRMVSDLKDIGHTFASASSDEVLIAKPSGRKVGIVYILAEVASGLTSPTVTLKDGTTEIGTFSVPAGDAISLIESPVGLELDGDLVAQVSNTGITVSAWGVEV